MRPTKDRAEISRRLSEATRTKKSGVHLLRVFHDEGCPALEHGGHACSCDPEFILETFVGGAS